MLVPTGTDPKTLEFGVAYEGSVEFANGIEENKLYRASDGSAIEVKLVKSHPCVDLGLTSGTLWAACNIGAVNDRPDQYGDYYRWGDKTCVTSTGIDLTINNCPWHTTGSNDKTGCTKYVPSDKLHTRRIETLTTRPYLTLKTML